MDFASLCNTYCILCDQIRSFFDSLLTFNNQWPKLNHKKSFKENRVGLSLRLFTQVYNEVRPARLETVRHTQIFILVHMKTVRNITPDRYGAMWLLEWSNTHKLSPALRFFHEDTGTRKIGFCCGEERKKYCYLLTDMQKKKSKILVRTLR